MIWRLITRTRQRSMYRGFGERVGLRRMKRRTRITRRMRRRNSEKAQQMNIGPYQIAQKPDCTLQNESCQSQTGAQVAAAHQSDLVDLAPVSATAGKRRELWPHKLSCQRPVIVIIIANLQSANRREALATQHDDTT